MKPSSARIRAISRFTRDDGMLSSRCRATLALRMRVSMSAIGSVTFMWCSFVSSAVVRSLPWSGGRRLPLMAAIDARRPRGSASSYQLDLVTPGSWPSRARSRKQIRHIAKRRMYARDRPHTWHRLCARTSKRGVRFDFAILDFLATWCSSVALERHAEELEELSPLLVGLRRRHDADLEPAQPVDLVVVDLGVHELLAEAEAEVAAAVERARRDAAEVADAWQRQRHRSLQEVVHPLAAKRDLRADRHPGPQPELRDAALGAGHDWLLSGDRRQVADGGVERLRVGDGLPEPDVDDDLLDARDLHRVRIAELALQGRHDLVAISAAEPLVGRRGVLPVRGGLSLRPRVRGCLRSRCGARTRRRLLRGRLGLLGLHGLLLGAHFVVTSICSPHCLQTRVRLPFSSFA